MKDDSGRAIFFPNWACAELEQLRAVVKAAHAAGTLPARAREFIDARQRRKDEEGTGRPQMDPFSRATIAGVACVIARDMLDHTSGYELPKSVAPTVNKRKNQIEIDGELVDVEEP